MNYRVERSPLVWRDLEEIANYIAEENIEAALRFYDAAEDVFNNLAQMPAMGVARTFQNSRVGEVRMWPIPDFETWLIFYRPTDKGIEVLRVIHSAQDIQSLFSK